MCCVNQYKFSALLPLLFFSVVTDPLLHCSLIPLFVWNFSPPSLSLSLWLHNEVEPSGVCREWRGTSAQWSFELLVVSVSSALQNDAEAGGRKTEQQWENASEPGGQRANQRCRSHWLADGHRRTPFSLCAILSFAQCVPPFLSSSLNLSSHPFPPPSSHHVVALYLKWSNVMSISGGSEVVDVHSVSKHSGDVLMLDVAQWTLFH